MFTRTNAITLSAFGLLTGTAYAQPCPTVTKLVNANPFTDGKFGQSIKMAWDGIEANPLLVVGEPGRDNSAGDDNRGGMRIYRYVGGAWSSMFSTSFSNVVDGEEMGTAVGISDRFTIAGAPGFSGNNGRVHIYSRPNYSTPFGFEAHIAGPPSVGGSTYGSAAAISTFGGGWCIVGAPTHGLANGQTGAAYVYTRQANGTWVLALQLDNSDNGAAALEHRGQSVAMSQSSRFAAIGAPNGEDAGQPADHGVVTVIERLNNGLVNSTVVNVRPPNPEAGEHFGASVAIEGSLLVVGSPDEDLTLFEGGSLFQATDCGAIYVFERGLNAWSFVAKLRSSDVSSNAHFGACVATDGSRIIVSEAGTKLTHVFRKQSGAWQHQAALHDPDSPANGSFGTGVAVFDQHLVASDALDDHTFTVNPGAVYAMQLSDVQLPGDDCEDAIPLPYADYDGCTDLATPSNGTVTTCGNGGSGQGNDVWFEFAPTCDGNIILDTYGSQFDTVLSVHSSCPDLGGNNTLYCNDDASFASPNHRASLVTFNFTAGQTYLIRVSGYGQESGQFVLRHSEYYAGTSNDTCNNAQPVGFGVTTFDACQARTERTFGAQCPTSGGTPYNDIWFQFTSPLTQGVRIGTCGSTYDTVLSVFTGPSCPSDSPFIFATACNDDSEDFCGNQGFSLQSRTSLLTQSGQTYFVQVCGYSPTSKGLGQLTIEPYAYCNDIDFNNDGSLFDPQDIDAFLSVYSEGPCVPAQSICDSIDFNNDTSVFDPCDIDSFLLVFSEGPCTPCGL